MLTLQNTYQLYRQLLCGLLLSYLACTSATKQQNVILSQANNLQPQILKLALQANQYVRQQGLNKKNILTILDYSLPSTKQRFWVIDLNTNKVVYSICAAHGRNSGDNLPMNFSNIPNSLQSNLGVLITGDSYYGKHGLSLELFGQEPGFNSNAYSRRIVIHAAEYVSEQYIQKYGRVGRSWGCPALNPKYINKVINIIKNGTTVFFYYPEKQWLTKSKFLIKNDSKGSK